jgi:hypothetical protein
MKIERNNGPREFFFQEIEPYLTLSLHWMWQIKGCRIQVHFTAEDPFRFVERVTAADKARTEAELKLVCTYTPQNFLFNLVSSRSILHDLLECIRNNYVFHCRSSDVVHQPSCSCSCSSCLDCCRDITSMWRACQWMIFRCSLLTR